MINFERNQINGFTPNSFQTGRKILMPKIWLRYVCGRQKSDYRYSKDIVYNNFPFPDAPGTAEVQAAESAAQQLQDLRAGLLAPVGLATGKTLADLYDPNKMPAELLALHKELDAAVDACYGIKKGFESEARRVGWLFGKWKIIVYNI